MRTRNHGHGSPKLATKSKLAPKKPQRAARQNFPAEHDLKLAKLGGKPRNWQRCSRCSTILLQVIEAVESEHQGPFAPTLLLTFWFDKLLVWLVLYAREVCRGLRAVYSPTTTVVYCSMPCCPSAGGTRIGNRLDQSLRSLARSTHLPRCRLAVSWTIELTLDLYSLCVRRKSQSLRVRCLPYGNRWRPKLVSRSHSLQRSYQPR